jgi:hypothetical protein
VPPDVLTWLVELGKAGGREPWTRPLWVSWCMVAFIIVSSPTPSCKGTVDEDLTILTVATLLMVLLPGLTTFIGPFSSEREGGVGE